MKFHGFLRIISHFILFFLLIAFVVTCCMMLFLQTMHRQAGIPLTQETVTAAAKITMLNVCALTILVTTLDILQRKRSVDRPIRRISQASARLMQGDFSVRIQPDRHDAAQFEPVIQCINRIAGELESVETLRTDFIANVSHELKTPLAVLQNYGTLLQEPDLPEEKRLEYAKAVSHTSQNLAAMITNILKLNKLENQQIYPNRTQFDLSEQLRQCLLQFESMWEQNDIAIEARIDDEVTMVGDPELLALVWNNLFSNAFKFTEPGGMVSVCLVAENDEAVVTVSDTGCGMTAEVGAHIFEKFYQGDTSHATAGNGLGLPLVKRVIDILQGSIAVESAVGKGSSFTVRIRR